MSKKWKKPGAGNGGTNNDPKPSTDCKYDPASVQSVAIKETPNDEKWKSDQRTFWERQLGCATRLNIITAIGVLFAGIAAVGALFYGWVAYRQWSDANKNFRVDERAWVYVNAAMPGFLKPNEPPITQVTLGNSGKTPAFDFSCKLIH
jgi:hypothetical protein